MVHDFIEEREKSILSALYKQGQTSVSSLSKITLINRTSLYPMLEKLLQKGLVTSVQMEGRVYYEAIPRSELPQWIKRKKNEAEEEAKQLNEWVKHLESKEGPSLIMETKYVEGVEGVRSLYGDTWRENKEKTILAITDYEQAYKVIGKDFFWNDYFEQRVQHEVKVRSLSPESKVGREDVKNAKKLLREVRFIDIFQNLGIEMNIYDDKIALFSFDLKKPSGVLIKNVTMANAFKYIFEYLWEKSKKPR